MKELYWIDGYNLLFYLDETDHLEKGRERLLNSLNTLVQQAQIDVIIVFDGAKEFTKTHLDSMEIIYTLPNQTADDYILDDIESKPKKGYEFIVVSNDKHLCRSVKLLKAQAMKISQFLKLLVQKRIKRKTPPLPSGTLCTIKNRELERLLKIFEEKFKQYESSDNLDQNTF